MRAARPALLLAVLAAGPAHAGTPDARLLLAVASHRGAPGDVPLRYAERDARRVVAVLSDLGGVRPADTSLLVDPGPADLRRALETAAARVGQVAADGRRATLVFYYSGHADRRGLHLGSASFPHDELRERIRQTGAGVRVLVLDACESGGITAKGVVPVEPFALSVEGAHVEGEVVITSSAADEASLESARLGGSFFTHHLVAGLRGAADTDDARVTLAEAYSYAYRMTLAETGATRAGPQHPSFRLDLRGMGDLVLTDLRRGVAAAHLTFPPGPDPWMVLEHRSGPAVALLPVEREQARALVLPPGSYWLRRRGEDALAEARLELHAGEALDVERVELSPVAYAAVVRKGLDPERRVAHAVVAGAAVESPGLDGVGPLWGAGAAYRLDLPALSLLPSLTVQSATSDGAGVPFSHDEVAVGLAVLGTFELGLGVLLFGPEVRWLGMRQRFTGDAGAGLPDRQAWTLGYGTCAALEVPLGASWSLNLSAALDMVRLDVLGEGAVHRPRVRMGLGLGWGTW